METKTDHFLSLIIPVYKQEKTIVANVRQIARVLNQIRYRYEIIIVVDGILDSSLKKIKESKIPHVKTIGYIKNQGKAHAIRLGMKKAHGDYVMFIDAGQEIDPNGISMLIEHMEWYQADIIVGSKRHPASYVQYPPMRLILSYGYYYLVKLLFHIGIRDTQAGIKMFNKKTLEDILPTLCEREFAGDLEILVAADSMGHKRIFEAPIKLDYNLGSLTSAATLKAIKGIFIDTLAIFYRKNFIGHYKKVGTKRRHAKKK